MRLAFTVLVAASVAAGCATKRYVSREVGVTNDKVDSLASNLEQTQERIRRNEASIDAVNNESKQGVTQAKDSAREAYSKAADAEKTARGKLLYTITLSNERVTFPFDGTQISDDAKRIIDDAVGPIKEQNRGVYFEIEGHTDATGPAEYNLKLGEARAMAVRNYLHDEQGIALNRLAVTSSGASRPVADNDTPEHRAQNRRVVINILE